MIMTLVFVVWNRSIFIITLLNSLRYLNHKMFKIIKKEKIAENSYSMEISAPDIANNTKAGQFIMLIPKKNSGERIPLTIADSNKENGTIIIILAIAGKSTSDLANMNVGDEIPHIAGPLGHPSEIKDIEKVCLIGGGVGIAAIYPIAKEYAKQGKTVDCILGVRNKEFLFWEDKFEEFCNKVIVGSDDGSIGIQGNVVAVFEKYNNDYELNNGKKCELVIAIGPTIMMKFASLYMKEHNIPCVVSLNTLMVDGIGMCGGCRIKYKNEIKFVCVDGPEFDAKYVDFDEILNRNASYKQEEGHVCNLHNVLLPQRK